MKLFAKCSHLSPDCPHWWYRHEEVANAISHVIGMLLGVAALVTLIVDACCWGTARNIIGVAIFGSSLTLTYGASALYHFTRDLALKRHLQRLDHICIYLLIAGTYTPFTLVPLHGIWGWSLFTVIWGLASLGILFKLWFFGKWEWLSTLTYVLMGWAVLIAIVPLLDHLPNMAVIWLISGGLAYTFGVFFFLMETVPFMHTVWHLFVLAGSICHYFAVLFYVAPVPT